MVLITVGLLDLLGITALVGGIALISNTPTAPPTEWLDTIPLVDSWTVPGLVLGFGFGLGSLVVAYGVRRRPRLPWVRRIERATRHHWSWTATILLGLCLMVWIALELIYLPELSALELVYGSTGLALVVLPLLTPVRDYLETEAQKAVLA